MNEKKLFYRLLILFPITTIFQSGALNWINKALFAMVFLLLVDIKFIKKPIKKKELIVYAVLVTNYVYSLSNTKWPLYNFNDLFYMIFLVIYSLYIITDKQYLIQYFKDDNKYVLNIIRLWNVIVGLSIFLPSSYDKEWGGAAYFVSFTDSTFRLSPTALMVLILTMVNFILFNNKKVLIYTLVPVYCFYMGGSRTYLGVGILTFLVLWYMYCSKPRYFYLSLIPILTIAVIAIPFTAAGDKIAATSYTSSSYYDYWGTITSGRSVFWKADIESFNKESIPNRLLGCGFNYVYDVNLNYVNKAIWAHNDFINILLNFGYIGLVLYLYIMKKVFGVFKQAKKKIHLILKIMIGLIWLINAAFNMHYTYFCSMIAFPLIVVFVEYKYEKLESGSQMPDKYKSYPRESLYRSKGCI